MASLEWLFRGDLKDSHYSFEIDLSLCIWPPRYSVQSCVTVPRISDQKNRIDRGKGVFTYQ